MASSVAGSNSEVLEHVYAEPLRTTEDLVAALTAVDAKMLRPVEENAAWCTAIWNIYCNCEALMV
jgi:hypothetical protein